jgi:hypothetical protein
MRPYFAALAIAALILCCGCASTSPSAEGGVATTPSTTIATTTAQMQDHTFVQTITYTDENGTSVITKNKLTQTAEIEMTLKVETPAGVDEATYHKLVTGMTSHLLQMAFFNETALDEFDAQVEAWNAQECTVEDDSPADQRETTPGDNPIAGYTVQRVSIHLIDKESGAAISDSVITGPNEGDASTAYH